MTTQATTVQPQNPATEIRGRQCPRAPLSVAVERVKELHEKIKRGTVEVDTAAKGLGYKGVNGAALSMLGTLSMYGLITRAQGKITIGDLAFKILYPSTNGPDAALPALREAALNPKVFAEIHTRYHGLEESLLKNQLIRDFKFPDEAAGLIASVYKENVQYAKIDDAGKNEVDAGGEKVNSEDTKKEQPSTTLPKTGMNRQETQYNELSVPLGNGLAVKVPFPMTLDDFDLLLGSLNLWKKKLVLEDAKPSKTV